MPAPLLPTTVVGSYPQPDWLVNHAVLKAQTVPRVRLRQMWRVPEQFLEQAQDDATLIAIRDMERAGIDIITDGEMRRESYSNRFATALEGIDIDKPAAFLPLGIGCQVVRDGRRGGRRRVVGGHHQEDHVVDDVLVGELVAVLVLGLAQHGQQVASRPCRGAP